MARSRSGLHWRLLDVAAPGCSRAAAVAHVAAGLVNTVYTRRGCLRECGSVANVSARIGAASMDRVVIVIDSRTAHVAAGVVNAVNLKVLLSMRAVIRRPWVTYEPPHDCGALAVVSALEAA
ncbi:hypothetical protein EDB85DRAFT_1900096 [Lactarius pseudohatsudake]|nr:hypothetical protein EDB85DRAFT_1900096 [Lactarius pseudohatsudake]